MSRRFTLVTIALTAVVAFLIGLILAGGVQQSRVTADTPRARISASPARPDTRPLSLPVNFADVVQRVNPAVVNVEATSANDARRRGRGTGPDALDRGPRGDAPRRGAGSGFIIDADGSILTNNHVIDAADKIIVKLSDGRTLRARVVGSDPDSDIALIKVDDQRGLPVAPLGDSSALRMGEWVCAIGNPLGYEHSVTVGVVSYVGRKLFDTSLDNYIQTDAAINFGNSGGPLINARGEVIGINAAISSRASNIGFAVPINGASSILPQLRARGRVSRGYMGVALRDIDADLQESLKLPSAHGALIQDVTADSPAGRVGLRPYDLVLSFDGTEVTDDDQLSHAIAARAPGATVPLRIFRDGRELTVSVKLSERPGRTDPAAPVRPTTPAHLATGVEEDLLGLTVRDLDAAAFNRYRLPAATRGVLIARVEPLSASADSEVERGTILLEINRQAVESQSDYRRVIRALHPGEILTLYVYAPAINQRQIKTVRLEDR
jgi:serine protease Do